MNVRRTYLIGLAALCSLTGAFAVTPVEDCLAKLGSPVRCALAVSGLRDTGRVLVLPDGDVLVESTPEGREEPVFAAFFADSVYNYTSGTLRRSKASGPVDMGYLFKRTPSGLASQIREILADSTFTTELATADSISFTSPAGKDGSIFRVLFTFLRGLPLGVSKTVTSTSGEVFELLREEYSPLGGELPDSIDAAYLRRRFPFAFLPRLPHTAFKNIAGGARVDLREQARDAIVVFLDALEPATPARIAAARRLAAGQPLFWAFRDTRPEDVRAVLPALLPGETALTNVLLGEYRQGTVLRIAGGIIVETIELPEK